jgi:hypothetical protein
MKQLFFLAVLVFAGWYGWNHRDSILHRNASHEAVVENDTGESIQRIRLTVDGQTLVRQDPLPTGQSVKLPFKVANDSDFQLTWNWVSREGEMTWRGGSIAKGPLLQRHVFQVMEDGGVMYRAESMLGAAGAK